MSKNVFDVYFEKLKKKINVRKTLKINKTHSFISKILNLNKI
jgi:hypothetical protein